MKYKGSKYINIILRMVSLVSIILIVTFLFFIYWITTGGNEDSRMRAIKGVLDLETITDYSNDHPVYLDGEWEYFSGVFMEEYSKTALMNPQYTTLPISDIRNVEGSATYRIFLERAEFDNQELVLYISALQEQVHIFMNGVKLSGLENNDHWFNYSKETSLFFVEGFDPSLDKQELVISVFGDEKENPFYHSSVIISSVNNMITLFLITLSNEMLSLGMLLLILISGYIFMIFRPNHRLITAMTVFDAMLMFRIIFNLRLVLHFFTGIVPWLTISDNFYLGAQIFFLMMGGIAGLNLSSRLFDPDKETPRFLTTPPKWLYLVYAVVFPFHLNLFSKIGVPIIIITYIYTFVGVFYQLYFAFKKEVSLYLILQLIKTSYIGILIFFDILFLQRPIDYSIITLLYCIFFIIHVGFRLYDNNTSYLEVEKLNETLESTVIKRTKELEEANRTLSELSIRDPLTGAYNRLYFEQVVEAYFKEYQELRQVFHLCIFDLDYFKRINDQFGHDEGDEQLRFVVEICKEHLPKDCVFCRIGGEEFTVLFKSYESYAVLEMMESLRQKFETSATENPKRTTISVGVAMYQGSGGFQKLYKMSDVCLYDAKNHGRNRIYCNFEGESLPVG